MKVRIALLAALLGCLSAFAGEIVIVMPAEKNPRAIREPSRSERELGRTMDKARSHSGTGPAVPIIIDESTGTRSGEDTEQAIRDAQDYLRPSSGAAGGTNNTTVILRSVPPTETEKLRSKARAYAGTDDSGRAGKNCVTDVVNTVGVVGEGGANRNIVVNVSERGSSAVNVNCK